MHRCGERSRRAHRDRCRSVKRRPRMSAGGTASTLARTARWGELISLCFIDATAIGQMRYPLITGVSATSTPGLAAGALQKSMFRLLRCTFGACYKIAVFVVPETYAFKNTNLPSIKKH